MDEISEIIAGVIERSGTGAGYHLEITAEIMKALADAGYRIVAATEIESIEASAGDWYTAGMEDHP